ncbi:MAG: hypothetical protein L0K65_08345, partial [Actinomyces sp.]|nr:hypothetical protein [Actinomyces sp.]
LTMATAGHITARLKLVIEDAELDLGAIYLPLVVTRVSPEKAPYMHMGIGVDLENVRDTISEIFKQQES